MLLTVTVTYSAGGLCAAAQLACGQSCGRMYGSLFRRMLRLERGLGRFWPIRGPARQAFAGAPAQQEV
jgi:hypothetical protein